MDVPSPVLTGKQTRILWLLSQGRTREEIGHELDLSPSHVRKLAHRIIEALGALNTPNAVRIGLVDGHIGPWEDCGTVTAWRRHQNQEEATCAACKRGNAERLQLKNLMARRPNLPAGSIRLLRLLAAGRSNDEAQSVLGIVSRKQMQGLMNDTYRLLGVDHYAPVPRREAAMKRAEALGLLDMRPATMPRTPSRTGLTLPPYLLRVLVELAKGGTISEIAGRLGMDRAVAASKVSQIYDRLGVKWMDKEVRRSECIERARKAGLLLDSDTPVPPRRQERMLPPYLLRVLEEAERGGSLTEIGNRLGLSRETVGAKMSELYKVLGVKDLDPAVRRDEAIRRARKADLLPEPATA